MTPAPIVVEIHRTNFNHSVRKEIRHEGRHLPECVLKIWRTFVNKLDNFPVNGTIWIMFLNDCMWAVFCISEESENSREFW